MIAVRIRVKPVVLEEEGGIQSVGLLRVACGCIEINHAVIFA